MGLAPIFLLKQVGTVKVNPELEALIRGVVEPLGYELVGVQFLAGQPGGDLLRVYIDQPAGIGLDDCERVSHQLSGVLDVEDPIPGHYVLEISSPGLDRPLFTPGQFRRYLGREIKVRLDNSVAGRKRYRGRLLEASDEAIELEVDGEVHRLPLAQIHEARLVPEF